MTGGASAPSGGKAELAGLRPTLWQLFCFCLAGLGVIWLPLAVMQQMDALLAFVSGRELIADAALMLSLLIAVAFATALVGRIFAGLLGRLGVGDRRAWLLTWALLGLPLLFLCGGQFAAALKLWVQNVHGAKLIIGDAWRVGFLAICAAVLLLTGWTMGAARLIRALADAFLSLRVPALVLSALALGYTALHQPPLRADFLSAQPVSRPAAASAAPDIILITLDSLAADDAGLCGERVSFMPRLKEFARGATCFERYYSVSNVTSPTTGTMETATLPWTHWVSAYGGRIPAQIKQATLGHALQNAGYGTHSIAATLGASPLRSGAHSGYDSTDVADSTSLHATLYNSFSVFPDASSLPSFFFVASSVLASIDLRRYQDLNPFPADAVYAGVPALLANEPPARPSFLWLHVWPPHSPYLPPASTKYRLLPRGELDYRRDFPLLVNKLYDVKQQPLIDKYRLRYRETVMGADEKLGDLLDTLQAQGRLDRAMVVVTADHGESFERGMLGHGSGALHEPVIRIPLLIKMPGQKVARTIDTPVSQLDLPSTLLDVARARQLPQAEGKSLLPLLLGRPRAAEPVFVMDLEGQSRFRKIRDGRYVVIDGAHKLVYQLAKDHAELYDLTADPHERHDLAAAEPAVTARLRGLIRARIAEAEVRRERWFNASAPRP